MFPGAPELCDAIDNDCDLAVDEGITGTFYADTDTDGYGDPGQALETCEQPVGYVTSDSDCDDSDPDVNPASVEICNHIDDDCDGSADEGIDADGDGVSDCLSAEVCDGWDNDGNGLADEGLICSYTLYGWGEWVGYEFENGPCADDDLSISLDGVLIFDDDSGAVNGSGPITFDATPGQTIAFIAHDHGCCNEWVEATWIENNASGAMRLLDPGLAVEVSTFGVFYTSSQTIPGAF